jgi:hypothetical protein
MSSNFDAAIDEQSSTKVSKRAQVGLTTTTTTTTTALKEADDDENEDGEYKKGIATIGFICLLNASLAPVWHTLFASGNGPPPLF